MTNIEAIIANGQTGYEVVEAHLMSGGTITVATYTRQFSYSSMDMIRPTATCDGRAIRVYTGRRRGVSCFDVALPETVFLT